MSNRLYVGNISYTTTEDRLREAFETSGNIVSIRLMVDRNTGQSRGFGFVQFASAEEASRAMQDWNGQNLDGRRLIVNEARDRSSPNQPRQQEFHRDYGTRTVEVQTRHPNQQYGYPRSDTYVQSNDYQGRGSNGYNDNRRNRRQYDDDYEQYRYSR